jgi:DNA-binding transcriptional LysR family regulator
VADFITTYPGVTLDIDFNDRQVNLIESGLDMAIRITTQLDPTQVARRISTSRLLTLASPEYLARHGRPRTPADLAAHQCLGYTGTARATWPYRVDGEMQWVPVSGRLQANSGDALLDACQRGLGICRQPSFIAAPAIRAGLLTCCWRTFRVLSWASMRYFPATATCRPGCVPWPTTWPNASAHRPTGMPVCPDRAIMLHCGVRDLCYNTIITGPDRESRHRNKSAKCARPKRGAPACSRP